MNESSRSELLDSAKRLKDSSFSTVYINKDLTFMQRKELYERRRMVGSSARLQSTSGVLSEQTNSSKL